MFGLGRLLYVIVLSVNGIAVLSEDRFLNRVGWGSLSPQPVNQFQNQYGMLATSNDAGVKSRMVALISAIRTLLRLPLIVVNILIILYELILG
ncbi:CIC11C00000004028 [Sungouiella intermedia]|uniref:CIC11C00000000290 n=1 Tax=Sungouiella intermedia TaxID=45354 RepID=A0A1L0DDW9_9ASCO|nr:CIC11C00000000290 [[Candida] intermedia]SGZ54104.1 CIC11C00000004028 [[Candida] intermedia]